ncbi:MAG TPA: hypothetical protein DCQ63_03080 [Planktothrix sp. UBA8402]|nr:hypothetical protein [Planktothrix sp. UBA8402]
MARLKYSLEPGGEQRLVITHSWFFKNIKIRFDGEEIGKIAKLKLDQKEYFFILNDGYKLEIRLVKVHNFPLIVQLEILLNNQPVPGSPTDPHQQILEAYQAIELRMNFNLLIIFLSCFLGFLGVITGDIEAYEYLSVMIIVVPFCFIVGVIPLKFFINKIKKLSKNTLKFLIFISIICAVTGDGWSFWILYKICPALGAIDKLKQAGFTEYKKPNSAQSNSKTRKTPKVKPNQHQSSSRSVETSPSTESSIKNHNFGKENPNFNKSNNLYVEDIEFDISVENNAEDLISEAIINRMKKLNSPGYQLYETAKLQSNCEQYYQAGEAYDHSYSSFWGDGIFAGQYDRHFFEQLGISAKNLGAEQAQESAKRIMAHARESLMISCQCYLQALSLNPDHYWANLKLATALTAALQINACLSYWKQALKLNESDTSRAIFADSMGFDYRSIATKEVIYRLGLGGSSQNLSPNFIQKQKLARKLLRSNGYLIQKIPELSRG